MLLPPMQSESLGQIGDHSILIAPDGTSLWVTNIDSGQQVKIPIPPCTNLYSLVTHWSADGRFLSLACPITEEIATLAILDTQSGVLEPITQGRAISSFWSPSGNRLLVNMQPDRTHTGSTFVVDAESGNTMDLPVVALWPLPFYGADNPWLDPGQLVAVTDASMVWSPDATRIVLNSIDGLYVINADGTNPHLLEQANNPDLYEDDDWSDGGGFIGPLTWSQDDQWILTARERNSNQPLHPTSSIDRMRIRVNVDTGEVEILDQSSLDQKWSPDGAWYVGQAADTLRWSLYHADGTLAHTQSYDIGIVIWTPDSQQFIGDSYLGTDVTITVFDLNGKFTLVSKGEVIAWSKDALSPDGTLLVGDYDGTIKVFDLQGQQHAVFPSALFLGWRPRLRPGSSQSSHGVYTEGDL